ncbi:dTDP-4-dehydrorhamnose 3,5-epimerase family protein [Pseudonocardia sp. KRD291]|uniref:dTDP-4-dehydrorhamnose 3,5-epimerase family protein n=1 Tax=Pseudonocardia sp. KRD291 TaxID=2792007 RepID=UPI001C4A03F8|nr:dTDP-4-dehydrorhamnose 3,5-epimerase family protein [Pseudonocardia sp. KRD291]MBW0103827.1 dTDP-4-dehydrorhamnose 3,5-epimerase family protein [Pseudonocardia sp. KRD291]
MQVHRTVIDGVVQFVPAPHPDADDFHTATLDAAIAAANGVDTSRFIQDSQSRSVRGVIRGMHGRTGAGESKLVRCAHGAMHDIVIDARPGSPTFGRVASFLLDDTDMRQLYIPAGCLHGFQALTATVDTCYRIDTPHDPTEDVSVRFDDPDLAIRWPLPVGTMSEKDRAAGSWTELCARLGADPRRRTDALGLTNW